MGSWAKSTAITSRTPLPVGAGPDRRHQDFISHGYLFGTLIALTHEGQALLGAIHQPVVEDLLLGDGETTWLNGAPVKVRACPILEEAVFLTTSHYTVENHQNGPAFEEVARRAARYHTWGDCHGYYLVAVGGADVMTDPVMNFWDRAALVPIIEGAGDASPTGKGATRSTAAG